MEFTNEHSKEIYSLIFMTTYLIVFFSPLFIICLFMSLH